MKLALIGFGNAGSKILDTCIEYEEETGHSMMADLLVINTAKPDLEHLNNIPDDKKILIGQSEVRGQGVGADNDKGAELARQDMDEIKRALNKMRVHDIDAFLVLAGLGGGTGSGGAPVLADEISRVFDKPVYGLGVLPGKEEGGLYSHNAATSFQSFAQNVDNLIMFDNDDWKESGDTLKGGYEKINREIAERLVTLLAAGEVEDSDVAENVVDSNEIINTLGENGISTIGYAKTPVGEVDGAQSSGGILSKLKGGDDDNSEKRKDPVSRTMSIIRQATLGQLTLQCDVSTAERGLVLMSGPPDALSRKGIDRARSWVEEQSETHDVRGGDNPHPDGQKISGTVLLSGVTDVDRIEQLKSQAVETQEVREEIEEESDDKFDDLLTDDDDKLDPV